MFQRCIREAKASPGTIPIISLIKSDAATLEENEDLVWICNKLEQHGHLNPFGFYSGYVPQEDWLPFLQRIARGTINFAEEDSVAIDLFYAAEDWRKEHGYPMPTGLPLVPPSKHSQ
jgi:hypothetical protein